MPLPFIRYSSFWRQEGDFQDVLLSSVVEMRRNLEGYPFRGRMSEDDRDALIRQCTGHIYTLRSPEDGELQTCGHR